MMRRRRGFLPPVNCEQCGRLPDLGQTLWPGEWPGYQWRCYACLEANTRGRDGVSKSMTKTLEYAQTMQEVFDLEQDGMNAEGLRNKAEWARYAANEIKRQASARGKEITQAHGEAVSGQTNKFLVDTLTVPDLPAVEASLDRSRLLLDLGPDMAAMGIDAADSIQASNSLEKMLAHQLAAIHKSVMEQLGACTREADTAAQAKRLNATARCMKVYQDGLLTLCKIRQNGNQRIIVQYVNVSNGSQAILGDVVKSQE